MQRWTPLASPAALLDRDSIDTDQILPASFMRGIDPDYAAGLFGLWRRDPAFILNQPGYANTAILVSGNNFGCGSTREHACWALAEFGIRALVAGSFGEVFRDNCVRNGVLPVTLPETPLDELRALLRTAPGPVRLTVDLPAQRITAPGYATPFDLPPADRTALLEGLDEIGMTLRHADALDAWEDAERARRPWNQFMPSPQ